MPQRIQRLAAAKVMWRLVEVEEEGVVFYQALAQATTSPWVRRFALWLVKAEMRHRDQFQEYALEAEQHQDEEEVWVFDLPDELLALLGARILPSKDSMLQNVPFTDDREAVEMAIRAEEHAAILLTRIREYVIPEQQNFISRTIQEEWNHKAQLEELLAKLAP